MIIGEYDGHAQQAADAVSKRWGLSVAVDPSVNRGLPAPVETAVYRIAQEALNNVARHARATHADLVLVLADHKIVCSIRDDGVGFDEGAVARRKGSRGLGLAGIKERVAALGGVLRLGPHQGRGTELTVEIPLER